MSEMQRPGIDMTVARDEFVEYDEKLRAIPLGESGFEHLTEMYCQATREECRYAGTCAVRGEVEYGDTAVRLKFECPVDGGGPFDGCEIDRFQKLGDTAFIEDMKVIQEVVDAFEL